MALIYLDQSVLVRTDVEGIPWSGIADKLRGRNLIDCKNKFMQLFELIVKMKKYDDMRIVRFLEEQEVEN